MSSSTTRIWRRLALIATVLLYGWVAFFSPGYDDEIFNISIVESKSFAELYTWANLDDVHPAGQYLINRALWSATGNWPIVRLLTAVTAALSIWLVWRMVRWPTRLMGVFAYVAICLNPASLLWCASLRWYAYFVPVFNLLCVLLLRNPASPAFFWGAFFLLSTTLLQIGYAALALVPVAFAIALHGRRREVRHELWYIATCAAVALLLSFYQLTVFFTVHARNSASQTSELRQAILQVGMHVLSNQGAYPVSVLGIILIAGNLLLLFTGLISLRSVRLGPASALFVFGALVLCATTLSGKVRNMVTVSTFQGVFQTMLFGHLRSKPLLACAMCLITVGNAGSIINVVRHRDTTKGMWNTPYAEVLADLQEKQRTLGCERLQVVTHDLVVSYHASRQPGATVVTVGRNGWREQITRFMDCQAAVQTYRGFIDKNTVDEYAALISELPGRVETVHFGPDAYAGFKRRFDPDIPDYYVRVTYFAGS
jgi:hypothetical protein